MAGDGEQRRSGERALLEAVSLELDRREDEAARQAELIRAYLAGYGRATEDALAAIAAPSRGRKWWRLVAAIVGVRGGH